MLFVLAFVAGISTLFAGTGGIPQASISLKNSSAQSAYYNNASWSLSKTGQFVQTAGAGVGVANWSVNATRVSTTPNTLAIYGYLEVTNTGAAPAPVGNIVVNLQRPGTTGKSGTNWVSVSKDVVTSRGGNSATGVNIVASATSESSGNNALYIEENLASGNIEFFNLETNSVFSLETNGVISPGATVTLAYIATFNNTILNIPVGGSIRAETIVTFGNAGDRGGSGAVGNNIDINGDVLVDSTETNVRSVPSRTTLIVPQLVESNNTVALVDEVADLNVNGTVTLGGFVGGVNGSISTNAVVFPTVPASGGEFGGTITNTATLVGDSYQVALQTVYGPVVLTLTSAVSLEKSSTVVVPAEVASGGDSGNNQGISGFYSLSQGYYANHSISGLPSTGFSVGNPLSISFLDSTKTVSVKIGKNVTSVVIPVSTSDAVNDFLKGLKGTPNKLTANLVNPTSSSAGNLATQVLALKLNVLVSQGVITVQAGHTSGFAALTLTNVGSLSNYTVGQVLASLEIALGGGEIPEGYTYASLNELADCLNLSFDDADGIGSLWAQGHLVQ